MTDVRPGQLQQRADHIAQRHHIKAEHQHLREALRRHREQRADADAGTTGCSCGWAPRPEKSGGPLLTQFLQHQAEEVAAVLVRPFDEHADQALTIVRAS